MGVCVRDIVVGSVGFKKEMRREVGGNWPGGKCGKAGFKETWVTESLDSVGNSIRGDGVRGLVGISVGDIKFGDNY